MRAPGYRIAPLAVVLALVALVLAVSGGWLTGSGNTATGGKAFVPSGARRGTTVWAVGDGPDGGADAARVARLITRANPDRLLYLGDVYEDGTAGEFARNYDPLYGGLATRTAPTPGN